MDIEDQLKSCILSKYRSVNAFSKSIGVPNTTVVTILDKGIMRAGVQTVIRIFNALDLDVESITSGTLQYKTTTSAPVETGTDVRLNQIIDCYNGFNDTGKEKLASYAQDLKITGIYDKHSNIQSEMNA